MIDFHCHLDLFDNPKATAQQFANAQNYVLSVTTTPKAYPKTASLAKEYSRIKTAIGLHPQLAHERENELSIFDLIVNETRYVGEVGLDGGKEFKFSHQAQLRVFRHVLKSSSKAGGKILSIHSRHAAGDVLECLGHNSNCGIPVLHWFTGNSEELRKAIDFGCWFSVGLPMIKSKKGASAIKIIPKGRILTETDAPFTGTSVNADLLKTEKLLAEIWSITNAETSAILKSNLRNLLSHNNI